MPYIKPLDRITTPTSDSLPIGELNYLITRAIDRWLKDGLCYERINAAIGVLECAKLELYRRIAAPYEDKKCRENGDVYSPENITS